MWMGKFLDLDEGMPEKMKIRISKKIKKGKLTPLEFTILESIFRSKQVSGYDLIHYLNEHFAGTWKARSGTIYPILSKLSRDGFLKQKAVKSPIGPLKKLYSLTEAGEDILKFKVNKNFKDQVKFTVNFLIDLTSIYLDSFAEAEREEMLTEITGLLGDSLKDVLHGIHSDKISLRHCPSCKAEIRKGINYCSECGTSLT